MRRIRKIFRRKYILRFIYWGFTGLLLIILFCNLLVYTKAKKHLYDQVEDVPARKTALVLGTSKYVRSGWINLYFKYRIQAAVELYKTKKVRYILVSGDNSTHQYNEPLEMKKELMRLGIPENDIVMDYAGFRTLDSVIRAREVFGQEEFIVVSQDFHNRRAVFIGKASGIDVVGYNAAEVKVYNGLRTKLREAFARVKVVIDIYLLKKQPHFLGDPVSVGS